MPITTEQINASISVNSLMLTNKELTDSDVALICDYLRKNPRIIALSLSHNNIGAAGASALADIETITQLDLSNNAIKAEGATALAAHKTLTHLNVTANDIGDAGAIALAGNKTITVLNVTANNIGEAGAIALAGNKTITLLSVAENDIGDAGKEALAHRKTIMKQEQGDAPAIPPSATSEAQQPQKLSNTQASQAPIATMTIEDTSEAKKKFDDLLELLHNLSKVQNYKFQQSN